jgi:hypothetical protein
MCCCGCIARTIFSITDVFKKICRRKVKVAVQRRKIGPMKTLPKNSHEKEKVICS